MARIMIVEDEPITAADLEQKLAALGHEVTASLDNGEAVVSQAPSLAPDLVLMDIRLRGVMNGIEAARQLRACSDVPIVFLTAFADQEAIDLACETEPHGYLVKPFTERAVASAVQVALTRAKSEQARAQRERWMSAALRGAGEALIAVDERGAIRFVNEHAEVLLNFRQRDVLGKDVRHSVQFADGKPGESAHPFDVALRDGQMTASANRGLFVAGRGALLNVAYCAAPVLAGNGARAGAVLVFRETSRAEATRGVELTDALVTLPMRLSHEINNPLTYNLAALQLALTELDQLRAITALTAAGTDESAAQREQQLVRIEALLRGAQEGATRVADVMRELRSFSEFECDPAPVQPVELLDLAIGLSGLEANAHLRLTRDLAAAPVIRGNRWQLSRVLAYLMQHAVESLDPRHPDGNVLAFGVGTDAAGWAIIRLQARAPAPSLRAPGPKPRAAPLDVARTSSVSMTMAQHVIATSGGDLAVREEPEGRTLEVRLPPLRAAATRSAASAPPRRASVLVVDDEPMVGRMLEMTLRREHDVTTVSSASSALALIEQADAFDVILCDLELPEMDGQELYERLCATRPDVAERMIFISGGATTERGARFLDAMVGRRLDKPFATAALIQLVRQRLQARATPDARLRC